jgi:hypothetical protein
MIALAVSLLLGATALGSDVDVTIDMTRSPLCQPPNKAIKSCISADARFHVEMSPSTSQVVARLISVNPQPMFSAWAACLENRWLQVFPEMSVPAPPRDVTVHFGALDSCRSP